MMPNSYQYIFYITGLRGVGKTTLIREISYLLRKNEITFRTLEEWSKPPQSNISNNDFAEWLLEERIKRDNLISKIAKEKVIICDRSPICPLVFALVNLNTRSFLRLFKKYCNYQFIKGCYYFLVAKPETICQRLMNRQNDHRTKISNEQIIENIKLTESAYKLIFNSESIVPTIFANDNVEISVLANKFLNDISQLISK